MQSLLSHSIKFIMVLIIIGRCRVGDLRLVGRQRWKDEWKCVETATPDGAQCVASSGLHSTLKLCAATWDSLMDYAFFLAYYSIPLFSEVLPIIRFT